MTAPSRWATARTRERPAPTPIVEEHDVDDLTVTGPTHPSPGVPVPDIVDQLSVRTLPSRTSGLHWWLGVHGGSGASTLAALDENGADARHVWPTHRDGQNVVIVCRESVQGLTAARNAAQHWASGELRNVNLLALVTVPAVPGKLDRKLDRLMHVVSGGFPRHYRTEWHPQYMTTLDPNAVVPNRRVRTVIRTIDKLSTKH